MGFEQLAALKAKLAEQAKKEAREKQPRAPRRPAPAAKAKPPAEGKAATAKPKAEAPVDPVVRTFGKLQKRFPLAFPKNPAPKVPLKVGIFEDLMTHAEQLGLTEAELRDAIRTWCRGGRYWACLTEGAPRVDLAGEPAGEVTAADARRGRQLLAGRSRQGQARAKKPAQPAQPTEQAAAGDAAPPAASAPQEPAAPTPAPTGE